MFFYVSLFIACAISAILAIYLFNVIANVSKAVFKGFLPSQKDNITSHAENVRFHSKVNDTPTPWGWKGGDLGTREHGVASNGATGLDAFVNKHSRESAAVGWPYREERNEIVGKAYKVSRKAMAKKSRLSTTNNQPWGW